MTRLKAGCSRSRGSIPGNGDFSIIQTLQNESWAARRSYLAIIPPGLKGKIIGMYMGLRYRRWQTRYRLEQPRCKLEDNIKINLKEIIVESWTELVCFVRYTGSVLL
jgi:hypothetical protein